MSAVREIHNTLSELIRKALIKIIGKFVRLGGKSYASSFCLRGPVPKPALSNFRRSLNILQGCQYVNQHELVLSRSLGLCPKAATVVQYLLLYCEELRDLCRSPSIVRIVKCRGFEWPGHVTRLKTRNGCRMWSENDLGYVHLKG